MTDRLIWGDFVCYQAGENYLCEECARRIYKKFSGKRDKRGVPVKSVDGLEIVEYAGSIEAQRSYQKGGDDMTCSDCNKTILLHKSKRPYQAPILLKILGYIVLGAFLPIILVLVLLGVNGLIAQIKSAFKI